MATETEKRGYTLLGDARRRAGLGQLELASRARVSRSLLSSVERGSARPSEGLKARIAEALARSVDELWPTWWVLGAGGSPAHLEERLGRVAAWTSRERAEAAAEESGGQVLGPVTPTELAPLLDVVQADVPARLLIDPPEGAP